MVLFFVIFHEDATQNRRQNPTKQDQPSSNSSDEIGDPEIRKIGLLFQKCLMDAGRKVVKDLVGLRTVGL